MCIRDRLLEPPAAAADAPQKKQKQQKKKQKVDKGAATTASDSITSASEDFSAWYADVIRGADLVDASPVKGCMVIKPWGMAVWDRLRDELDGRIKASGAENAYFPLLIPRSFLSKEAEHVLRPRGVYARRFLGARRGLLLPRRASRRSPSNFEEHTHSAPLRRASRAAASSARVET